MMIDDHNDGQMPFGVLVGLKLPDISIMVFGVQCDVENCLMQLYVGLYHVISSEIAVAKSVPIENPADCEVRGVIRFLQADEILGYLAEK